MHTSTIHDEMLILPAYVALYTQLCFALVKLLKNGHELSSCRTEAELDHDYRYTFWA